LGQRLVSKQGSDDFTDDKAFATFLAAMLDLAFEMALRGGDQITIYRALMTGGCPESIAQTVAKRAHAMANRGNADHTGHDPSASSGETASGTSSAPPRPRRPQPPDDKEETRKAGPGARFWARTLDLLVVTPPALILSSTIDTVGGGSRVLFLLAFGIAVLLPFFLDACVVGLFGNSLGKALLGITVHHKDSRKPGFHDTLKRNLYVCGYGYWTGLIPFVSWIPMLIAYRDLGGKKGETKWDAALGYEVRRTSVNVGQIVGFAVAFGFTLGVVLSVSKQTVKQELKAGGLFADIPDATNKQTLKQVLKAATNYFDQFDAPHADIAAAPKSTQATAPRDPAAERDRLQERADSGDAEAQHSLAISLMTGSNDQPRDAEKSLYYFKKAAEQGHAEAQFWLGTNYAKGYGVPKDLAMSAFWNLKAAEGGSANAQEGEGWKHFDGLGVAVDDKLAFFWFSKAAQQGNVGAQRGLGKIFQLGRGVPQSWHSAAVWFRKAAEQGDATSQGILGILYFEGLGLPVDLVQAYMWSNLAASSNDPNGDEQEKKNFAEVRGWCEQRMSRSQIEQAQELTRVWLATHKPWWGGFKAEDFLSLK
jgi:TPR repeat protein/uncharacterized RDD family membrane protein YckC